MNIAALERDLEKKQAEARALFEKTAKQAEAEDREFTAEERAAVETLLAEAKAIKTKLDRLKADASMRDQIDQLLGEERSRASAADPSRGRRSGIRVDARAAIRRLRCLQGVPESDQGRPRRALVDRRRRAAERAPRFRRRLAGFGRRFDRPGLSTGHSAAAVPPADRGGSHRAGHDRLERDHLHERNGVHQQRRYGRRGRGQTGIRVALRPGDRSRLQDRPLAARSPKRCSRTCPRCGPTSTRGCAWACNSPRRTSS